MDSCDFSTKTNESTIIGDNSNVAHEFDKTVNVQRELPIIVDNNNDIYDVDNTVNVQKESRMIADNNNVCFEVDTNVNIQKESPMIVDNNDDIYEVGKTDSVQKESPMLADSNNVAFEVDKTVNVQKESPMIADNNNIACEVGTTVNVQKGSGNNVNKDCGAQQFVCVQCKKCITDDQPEPCNVDKCVAFGMNFCANCFQLHLCRRKVVKENTICSSCGMETKVDKFDWCRQASCNAFNVKNCVECMSSHYCSEKQLEPEVEEQQTGRSVKHTKRRQVMCPLEYCKKCVTDLSRHLQTVHKYPKEKARGAMSKFGLRKPYTNSKPSIKSKVVKDYHKYRLCPVSFCESIVQRLDEHLRKSHKMSNKSEKYNFYLQNAIFTQPGFSAKKSESSSFNERLPGKVSFDMDNRKNDAESDLSPSESASETENEPEDADPTYQPENSDTRERTDVLPESENLIQKFYLHMISPNGGNRDEVSAKKDSLELKRIYRNISATSITDLLNPTTLNSVYLSDVCKKKNYKADTVRKYLNSLRDFCQFIVAEEIEIPNMTFAKVNALKAKVDLWSKRYRKASKERFWERAEEDYEMLVTPEQIDQYERSNHARAAIKLFGNYSSRYCSNQLNLQDYCRMRDYLFCKIHFTTGHGSGVTAHMNLKEFGKALRQGDENSFVIKVRDHKTFSSHGYAQVVLEAYIYGWLQIYVNKVRCQLDVKSDKVFLAWTGNAMDSGDISRRIHELWKKAGIYKPGQKLPKRLSVNIIRKSASSGVREQNMERNQETADIMAHSVKTAETHYVRRNKEKSAVVGAQAIRSYFYGNSCQQIDSGDGQKEESIIERKSKKRFWTKEENEILETEFAEEILNKNITINDIRDKLFSLKVKNVTEKQLYDKIRSLYRYETAQLEKDKTDTSDSSGNEEDNVSQDKDNKTSDDSSVSSEDHVCASSISNIRTKLFSNDETAELMNKCQCIIKGGPITRDRVVDCLGDSILLTKYTFVQLRTRLTYERNKLCETSCVR